MKLLYWYDPSYENSDNKILSSPSILTWREVETKLPWGIIFLLGGGLALAEGFKVSGLAHLIGDQVFEYSDKTSCQVFRLNDICAYRMFL